MLNWVVSSSVLIVAIIILRFFLKGKISLRVQYALWAIVLLRLLLPFSIGETAISVGNWLEQLSQKEEVHDVYEFTQVKLPEMSYQQAYQEVVDRYENQGIDIQAIPEDEFAESIEYEIQETMAGELSLVDIAKRIWGIGSFIVGLWFLFTNIRFWQKVRKSRKEFCFDTETMVNDTKNILEECKKKINIYLCDEVETPCLFGLFHSAIYVTSEAIKDEEVLRHVIAHEMTHYLHRDFIWGYLRALCLAIHWYNPFVWYAAVLSRNDAELACDEVTIAKLGETQRASYGRTLIGLTCEKPAAVLLTATTMTGSGKSIKERISLIVRRPKMKRYTLIAVILIAIICVGCTFTGAKNDKPNVGTHPEVSIENSEQNDGISDDIDSEVDEERLENTLSYDSLTQDMLVTDTSVKNKVLQLLLDEKKLIDTIECQCEMDFEQSMDVEGIPHYRVLEADSWAYYANIARNYYSDGYLKEKFTERYTEETKLFVEANGKLYRAPADGVTVSFLEDSINVWKVDDVTYYATITSISAAGEFFLNGYRLCLSENDVYGFVITDKLYVETNAKDFTYFADLTQDGIDERVRVSINGSGDDTQVRIRVYDEEILTVIYETELLLHPNLGGSYFLSNYDGKDYLMYYKPSVNHEAVSCEYEVFYLSDTGEKIVYDADGIEVSLYEIPIGGPDGLDITVWKMLAEKENKYFDKAFLLASTMDGKVAYSTEDGRITYIEDFSWLSENPSDSIENNLELFWKDIQEQYGT